MEQLATRFNRCTLRNDAENVANLAADLGEEGVQCLRSTLRGGAVAEAVEIVGLLCKLDPRSVEVFLPARMKEFPRNSQDRVLRQISASGSPGRCRILLEVLDVLDPLVMPLAIDEIGVTGDRDALGRLLTIVDGDLPAGGGTYLRVKAVEALGRISAPESVTALKRIVGAEKISRLDAAARAAHRRDSGARQTRFRVGRLVLAAKRPRPRRSRARPARP